MLIADVKLGWITKWSSSCVYVIVTNDRYERKSWSRAVL